MTVRLVISVKQNNLTLLLRIRVMSNFGITISCLRQLHHCYLIRYLSVTSLNMAHAHYENTLQYVKIPGLPGCMFTCA